MATDPGLTQDQKKSLRDSHIVPVSASQAVLAPVLAPDEKQAAVAGLKTKLQNSDAGKFARAAVDQVTDPRSTFRKNLAKTVHIITAPNSIAAVSDGDGADSEGTSDNDPAPSFDHPVAQSAQAGGKVLPGGLRRYDVGAGNEAKVYVGKNAQGNYVFTDAPNDVAGNGGPTHGLKKTDRLYARTAGPNADRAYGKNTLQLGGYTYTDPHTGKPAVAAPIDTDKALMTMSPAEARASLAQLAAHSAGAQNPETIKANAILANQLRARADEAPRVPYGLARGRAAAGVLTPKQAFDERLGVAKFKHTLANDAANRRIRESNAQRQASTEQRAALKQLQTSIAGAKDPNTRAQLLFDAVPPDADKKWADSPEGQFVISQINRDIYAASGGANSGAGLRTLKFQPGITDNFSISRPNYGGSTNSASRPWYSLPFGVTEGQTDAAPGGGGFNRFPEAYYAAANNKKLRGLRRVLALESGERPTKKAHR